jgi:hypothetical protein
MYELEVENMNFLFYIKSVLFISTSQCKIIKGLFKKAYFTDLTNNGQILL